jgi:hypothetical protein
MPSKRRRLGRGRRGPPINEAQWLFALGRVGEAKALQSFIEFLVEEREPRIWEKYSAELTREYQRDHPGEKPPIQIRLEKAEAEREEQRRWREQHGDR